MFNITNISVFPNIPSDAALSLIHAASHKLDNDLRTLFLNSVVVIDSEQAGNNPVLATPPMVHVALLSSDVKELNYIQSALIDVLDDYCDENDVDRLLMRDDETFAEYTKRITGLKLKVINPYSIYNYVFNNNLANAMKVIKTNSFDELDENGFDAMTYVALALGSHDKDLMGILFKNTLGKVVSEIIELILLNDHKMPLLCMNCFNLITDLCDAERLEEAGINQKTLTKADVYLIADIMALTPHKKQTMKMFQKLDLS